MANDRNSEVRWETPVSDAEHLVMDCLLDQNDLHVTVQDLHGRRFRFSFQRVPAYRNILEEYRLGEPKPLEFLGWTRTDPESSWLADLRSREGLLDLFTPGCVHYIIETGDDVIDVLAPIAPRIVEIDDAREGV